MSKPKTHTNYPRPRIKQPYYNHITVTSECGHVIELRGMQKFLDKEKG